MQGFQVNRPSVRAQAGKRMVSILWTRLLRANETVWEVRGKLELDNLTELFCPGETLSRRFELLVNDVNTDVVQEETGPDGPGAGALPVLMYSPSCSDKGDNVRSGEW